MTRKMGSLAVAAAAVLLVGCGSVRIARINADPSRYQNRQVSVTGTVVNAVGLLGTGGYQVDDGTGTIAVISSTGVPSRGSRVTVTGTVMSAGVVLGQPIGTAIRERHHRIR
jgi:hypothetical protein